MESLDDSFDCGSENESWLFQEIDCCTDSEEWNELFEVDLVVHVGHHEV